MKKLICILAILLVFTTPLFAKDYTITLTEKQEATCEWWRTKVSDCNAIQDILDKMIIQRIDELECQHEIELCSELRSVYTVSELKSLRDAKK